MLGLLLDRLIVMTKDVDIVNLPAVEAICRKVYGLIRCFEDVACEDDWKPPRNHNGKWRSKIKWDLLKEYEVRSLESSEWVIQEADDEVSERIKKKALFAKHWSTYQEAAPPVGSFGPAGKE